MDDGTDTDVTRQPDADDHVEFADADTLVDLAALGLTDEFVAGAAPDAAVTFPLFDGAVVKGPFHKMGARGPLIEVWQVEILRTGQGTRGKMGGYVGTLDHDADVADLLEEFGVGIWLCRVRKAGARFGKEKWVKVGTVQQRRDVAERRRKHTQAAEPDEPARPAWIDQVITAQREQMEALQGQLKDLQRERDKDRDEELSRLRKKLEDRPTTPAAAPINSSTIISAVEERMREAESLQALFGRAPDEAPSVEEADFITGMMSDLEKVLDQVEKGGKIMKMFEDD